MEYLCKITTSNYIVWLKTILKNNQKSGRGYLSVLRRLKKKHVWKAWTCLFLLVLLLATTFVTIQYKVISNRVLNLSSTVVQVNFGIYCSSIISFEPINFLPIFHPFVLNWPLKEQVHFGSSYLQMVNHDKRNM